MKLPNSYGSVIKLGGKRRKPYAVRISKLVEDDTGKIKRKYTYLSYFSKPEMAYTYLAEYNSGAVIPEHMKYSDSPTSAEMYEKWKKYRKSLKNQISDSTWRNYEIAFNHFSDLHSRKFISIRTNETPAPRWQTHLCFSHGQCWSKRCIYQIDYGSQHEKRHHQRHVHS